MIMKRALFAVLFVLSAVAGIEHSAFARQSSDVLIKLPGATDVRSKQADDGDPVTYKVDVPHPAQPAILEIRNRLERAGWRSLNEDFLNPDSPSSIVRGWTEFEEAVPGQRQGWVFQWMAQWEDSTGRIVEYVLRYDGVIANGEIKAVGPMQVTAILFSAERAKALRSWAKTVR
jgi:hypothetical protein